MPCHGYSLEAERQLEGAVYGEKASYFPSGLSPICRDTISRLEKELSTLNSKLGEVKHRLGEAERRVLGIEQKMESLHMKQNSLREKWSIMVMKLEARAFKLALRSSNSSCFNSILISLWEPLKPSSHLRWWKRQSLR